MSDDLRAMIIEVTNQVSSEKPGLSPGAGLSPVIAGWIGLVASERGLRMLTLPAHSRGAALRAVRRDYPEATLIAADPFLQEVARQVRAYLAG